MRRPGSTVYRERALLMGVLLGSRGGRDGIAAPHPADPRSREGRDEESLEELAQLATTAGAAVVGRMTQRRNDLVPATYIGRGKAEELAEQVKAYDLDVVIFDNDLAPGQIRNLERILKCKVIDRTELILDIFAVHARSHQARLQVELAQLEYTLPRLKGMWSHFERIVGGGGGMGGGGGIGTRGPGEKQIEVDRRMARKRLGALKEELSAIASRKAREVGARSDEFTVSLVGYTNAGKSTLMNALTGSGVLVEDKLFSTLDTKTHSWRLSDGSKVLLSDTVGFIRNLPHNLVASFHATLEEVTQADLLLHVVDASHEEREQQIRAVNDVLKELGCADREAVLVLNKVDLVDDPLERQVLREQHREAVFLSAATRDGVPDLEKRLGDVLARQQIELDVTIPAADGRLFAQLKERGKILSQVADGESLQMRMRLGRRDAARLLGVRMDGPKESGAGDGAPTP